MDFKERRVRPVTRYAATRLDGLRKTTIIRNQDFQLLSARSNRARPEHKCETLPPEPICFWEYLNLTLKNTIVIYVLHTLAQKTLHSSTTYWIPYISHSKQHNRLDF